MALTALLSAGLDLCPTQEMRENSWFGTSSGWDQPCLSRLSGQSLSFPPAHMPKGRLVRAAQVSVQPDRRNYCDKGEGRKHTLRASAVHGFNLAPVAQPGKRLHCP